MSKATPAGGGALEDNSATEGAVDLAMAMDLEDVSSLFPLVVVSPHYDDAVFSCGDLLAAAPRSTVVTVYTGSPSNPSIVTDWDQRCGFASAGEAMHARGAENRAALSLLQASGVDLEFLDSQYLQGGRSGSDLLGDALASTISQLQPTAVFSPLGLFHEDHIHVSRILTTICHRLPAIHWFAYADIPYCKQAERVRQRLGELADHGVYAVPLRIHMKAGRKAAALDSYQSQLRGLGYENGQPILSVPEQYWRLHCNADLL